MLFDIIAKTGVHDNIQPVRLSLTYKTILKGLTLAFDGKIFPAKGGQGRWLFQAATGTKKQRDFSLSRSASLLVVYRLEVFNYCTFKIVLKL
jgi:hypothetical protein